MINASETTTTTSNSSSTENNSTEICYQDAATSNTPISSYQESLPVAGGTLSFSASVNSGEGLVFSNVVAQGVSSPTQVTGATLSLFTSISIPVFRVDYGNQYLVVQYKDTDNHTDLTRTALSGGGYLYSFTFYKHFCGINDIKGTLTITYNFYLIIAPPKCELVERGCNRIIPSVTYNWADESGSLPTLTAFSASQKISYENTGFTVTSDSNIPFYNLKPKNLLSAPFRETILTQDVVFTPITDGSADSSQPDSLHTAYPVGDVGTPTVLVPGCRPGALDCIHDHWRWSGAKLPLEIDPLVDPITGGQIPDKFRGQPYLFWNPLQTVSIALLRDDGGIASSALPTTIADLQNLQQHEPNHILATTQEVTQVDYIPDPGEAGTPQSYNVAAPDPTVLDTPAPSVVQWRLITVRNSQSGTIFRNGMYIMDLASTAKRDWLNGLVQFGQSLLGANNYSPVPRVGAGPDGGSSAVFPFQISNTTTTSNAGTSLSQQINNNLNDLQNPAYWQPDNNSLVPATAPQVLNEVSNTVQLLLQLQSQHPEVSNQTALLLKDLRDGLDTIAYNTLVNATTKLDQLGAALNSTSALPSDLGSEITNASQFLSSAEQSYATAVSENFTTSGQFVSDFINAWTNTTAGTITNYNPILARTDNSSVIASSQGSTSASITASSTIGSNESSVTLQTGQGTSPGSASQLLSYPVAMLLVVVVLVSLVVCIGALVFRRTVEADIRPKFP